MLAYLAVACHLHFWQNDRDLLRATAETRLREWGRAGWGLVVVEGGGGFRNRPKSQHRKLTLENILLPLLPGLEPATF